MIQRSAYAVPGDRVNAVFHQLLVASFDSDLSTHTRIEMSGLQTREVEGADSRELPDELAHFSGLDAQLIGIRVLHLGELFHERRVFAQLPGCAEYHLVLHLPGVLNHKPNRFAL